MIGRTMKCSFALNTLKFFVSTPCDTFAMAKHSCRDVDPLKGSSR
jgi:hypothetical protein